MGMNKKCWTQFPTDIQKKMNELADSLGMSFAEFIRNSSYTIFLMIENNGIERVVMKPTQESSIKKIILNKEGD